MLHTSELGLDPQHAVDLVTTMLRGDIAELHTPHTIVHLPDGTYLVEPTEWHHAVIQVSHRHRALLDPFHAMMAASGGYDPQPA